MHKVWLDFETSGLDNKTCGLTQLAFIIEDEDGKVLDMGDFDIRPFEGADIQATALHVTNKTYDQVMGFEDETVVLKMFLEILKKHIDPKVRDQNFTVAAYNSQFDVGFLSAWMERNGKNYFHYFNYHSVDPLALLRILRWEHEVNLPSLKLRAVYKAIFNEDFDAHNALEDILATKKVYDYLKTRYLNLPRRS